MCNSAAGNQNGATGGGGSQLSVTPVPGATGDAPVKQEVSEHEEKECQLSVSLPSNDQDGKGKTKSGNSKIKRSESVCSTSPVSVILLGLKFRLFCNCLEIIINSKGKRC